MMMFRNLEWVGGGAGEAAVVSVEEGIGGVRDRLVHRLLMPRRGRRMPANRARIIGEVMGGGEGIGEGFIPMLDEGCRWESRSGREVGDTAGFDQGGSIDLLYGPNPIVRSEDLEERRLRIQTQVMLLLRHLTASSNAREEEQCI